MFHPRDEVLERQVIVIVRARHITMLPDIFISVASVRKLSGNHAIIITITISITITINIIITFIIYIMVGFIGIVRSIIIFSFIFFFSISIIIMHEIRQCAGGNS